jgi:hypothetical protein
MGAETPADRTVKGSCLFDSEGADHPVAHPFQQSAKAPRPGCFVLPADFQLGFERQLNEIPRRHRLAAVRFPPAFDERAPARHLRHGDLVERVEISEKPTDPRTGHDPADHAGPLFEGAERGDRRRRTTSGEPVLRQHEASPDELSAVLPDPSEQLFVFEAGSSPRHVDLRIDPDPDRPPGHFAREDRVVRRRDPDTTNGDAGDVVLAKDPVLPDRGRQGGREVGRIERPDNVIDHDHLVPGPQHTRDRLPPLFGVATRR